MNYAVKPPYLLRKFYGNLIWNFPTREKIIYLTFDDGPIPVVTPFVLEQLKQHNAKATFFCIGENVDRNPEIFASIKSAGHTAGNHTYNHLSGWRTRDEHYFENIKKADELIHSKLFRPPYGRIKKSQIKFLSAASSLNPLLPTPYSIIMWDALSYDYDKDVSKEKCFANVINNAREGSVVVFHDSIKAQQNLEYALPKTLEHFSNAGYRFKAIE